MTTYKRMIDDIAVRATDALAGHEATIGDAAQVMLQILAGCQAHLDSLKDHALDEGVESDCASMSMAIQRAKTALEEIVRVSKWTGGAL